MNQILNLLRHLFDPPRRHVAQAPREQSERPRPEKYRKVDEQFLREHENKPFSGHFD